MTNILRNFPHDISHNNSSIPRCLSQHLVDGVMETDCEFVLLGPGDVVINITNNNLESLPDLNTYLCNEGRESGGFRDREEVGSSCRKMRSTEEAMVAERPAEPPIFRAKRGRPCSEPPTREVVTKRRKVHIGDFVVQSFLLTSHN